MAFSTGNLDVAIKPDRSNDGDNSDKFYVTITNMAGQSLLVNGQEVDKLEFKNNAARRDAIKGGKASVGDGKDVAHKKSLENGGGNGKGNTTVQDRATNRGWRKGSGSYNPDK